MYFMCLSIASPREPNHGRTIVSDLVTFFTTFLARLFRDDSIQSWSRKMASWSRQKVILHEVDGSLQVVMLV